MGCGTIGSGVYEVIEENQAILKKEPHIGAVRWLTTLAGYVHWQLTGEKVLGVGDASGMFPIDDATGTYREDFLAQFDALPEALDEYETMYTVRGIQRSVERLTGKSPFIIEHFAVDPNDPSCKDPELYRKLYGDDPYRFFLLLPQDTFSEQRQMEDFLERLEELVPAETEPELVLLKPCVQLDWHTYLGVNSRIGDYVTAVIDETVTIHYDTTIGG